MIHRLLNLTRPLIVLDCETTGVNPKEDRIVEIGFQVYYPPASCASCEGISGNLACSVCEGTGVRPVKEWRTLVRPLISIPPGSTKVHGITNDMVNACRICGLSIVRHVEHATFVHHDADKPDHEFTPWPAFANLAANLAQGFTDCDFAGKRVRFDLQIVQVEMARVGRTWDYAGARIVDNDRIEALGEPRTLSDLVRKHLGREHDGAHGALADVKASAEVLAVQIRRYAMPRDLDVLHEMQWPGWIDSGGKFRFDDEGVPRFTNWGKYAGRPMRDADGGYYDWIVRHDFPLEVKRIAEAATRGEFPKRGGEKA